MHALISIFGAVSLHSHKNHTTSLDGRHDSYSEFSFDSESRWVSTLPLSNPKRYRTFTAIRATPILSTYDLNCNTVSPINKVVYFQSKMFMNGATSLHTFLTLAWIFFLSRATTSRLLHKKLVFRKLSQKSSSIYS